ncbi:MAG: hypothetical protein Q4D73_01180 [Actinomycetaceae bacterium]|nr:hypothetical protein [Actinomycetaceae bacterium]
MNWDIDSFAKQGTDNLEVTGTEVAVFRSAQYAQAAIRSASAAGADLRGLKVVGSDLRSVLYIEGRVTTFKHLLSGLMSGLWISLLVAFGYAVLWTQVSVLVLGLILAAGIFGGLTFASLGLVTGSAAHRFMTQKGLVASRYAIVADRDAQKFIQFFASTPGNLLRPETALQQLAVTQPVVDSEGAGADSISETKPVAEAKPQSAVELAPPQYGVRLPAPEQTSAGSEQMSAGPEQTPAASEESQ